MRLLPCPSCGRHVRSNEKACPFCAADVAEAFAAVPAARAIPVGLSRAAIAAMAAATMGACGGDEKGNPQPVYGGPPPGGASSTGGASSNGGASATGGARTTGGAAAAGGNVSTGGIGPADAGDDADGSGGTFATGGAASTGGMQAQPPYGIPPAAEYGAPPPPLPFARGK